MALLAAILPVVSIFRGGFEQLPEIEQAKKSGKQVEIKGERTATDTVWATPEGDFRRQISAVPIRAWVGDGWKPIDLNLVKASDGTVRPKASANAEVLSGGGDGPLLTSVLGVVTVATSWPDDLPVPSLDGSTATYADVFPGVDLKMVVTDAGTSQVLVVKDRKAAENPALRELKLKTTAKDGVVREANGGLSVVDNKGREVASAPPARMWDSSGVARDAKNVALPRGTTAAAKARVAGPAPDDAVADVVTKFSKGTMTLRPDVEALTGEDVVYPTYIDPMSSPNTELWAAVRSTTPSTSYYKPTNQDYMWVGNNNTHVQRMFWKFDIADLDNAVITRAQFVPRLLRTVSCTARQAQVYRMVDVSVNSSTTWNNQPAWMSGNSMGSVTEASNPPDCNRYGKSLEFNVLEGVREALYTHDNYVTFGLRADNETYTSGWMFFEKDTTLDVTYSFTPNKPIGLALADPVAGCGEYISGVKPRLRAKLIDLDGDNLRHEFQVFAGSTITGAPIWSEIGTGMGTTDNTSPASYFQSQGRVQNEDGELPGGKTYSWRVRALENNSLGLTGPWSDPCTFVVTNAVVGPPGILAVPPTWDLDGPPTTLTLTPLAVATAPAPSTFAYYRWSLDSTTPTSADLVPTESNKRIDIEVQPKKAGIHVLRVWAYNTAGSRSEPFVHTLDTNATSAPYAARYLFDESSGTTSGDAMSNAHPLSGLPSGVLAVDRTHGLYRLLGSSDDMFDGMLKLNGVQNPAKTTAPVIATNQSFTVSAWLAPHALSMTATRIAVSQGTDTDSNFLLGISPDCGTTPKYSCYRMAVRTTTGWQWVESTRVATAVVPGLVHVVGDVSVTATKSFVRIRVFDGDTVATNEKALTSPPLASSGADGLLIGGAKLSSTYVNKFFGFIDNVVLHQGLLDDVALLQLHAEDGGRCYISGYGVKPCTS